MINILNFYEAGKARSGRASIPFFDTVTINNLIFSTRIGNMKIKWGDGNETLFTPNKNNDLTVNYIGQVAHNYATAFTGNVEITFLQGLRDVYSINVVYWGNPGQTNKINIQDFGTYIKQFSNLYSIIIESYAYNIDINKPVIKGDLADIPASVERYKVQSFEILNNSTDVWFNFNSLPANSKLKFLDFSGDTGIGTNRKILGNLANLPFGCTFCRINKITSNSSITYTSGKVWPSSLDTLDVPLSLGDFLELDNVFIDLGNSIASAIGSKIINLGNGWVTQKSATQRSHLTSLGFTLSVFLDTSTGTASSTTKKFIGDIAQIPNDITFFKIAQCATGSAITYTSGKVWASSFDTLSIPLALTTAELDNLLIDMNNSIATKIGAGVIAFGGYRSTASDAAVASLVAKGFTVNVQKQLGLSLLDSSVIFRADFQNNFDIYSNSYLGVIAGGTSNQPTFALSGRKPGEYCAVFNGSQSIKTTANLPINSDKATVVFAMKTTQNASASAIFELSPNWVVANSFVINTSLSKLIIGEQVDSSTRNVRSSSANINDNTWKHIVVVFDRANPTATKITLYINGALAGTTSSTNGATAGNFVNNIAFIGQRAGNNIGFVGSLMLLKAYNYPLTSAEVAADYNAFL